MAVAPDTPGGGQQVFVVYTYKNDKGEYERVVRFTYEAGKEQLVNRVTVLEGIPAGGDHNGGRLVFGPDGKLYLTKGELGHNQGANFCKPNDAQRLPTADEMKARNYAAYVGKVLRMNPDGSIPADNPRLKGVTSHVFTYGHRNPQGLVWVGRNLYSSEQGPSSDDEINILVSGGNYGWPHVAGFRDDLSYRYANWSKAPECPRLQFDANVIPGQVPTYKESDWQDVNFREPAKTFYTVPASYEFSDARCAAMPYLCWPTIAPASVTHYPADGPIAAWRNSLLVTSLKNGTLYVLPLSKSQAQIQGDVTTCFRSTNRYRVARVSPDGKTLFLATDSSGNLIGQDGTPTDKPANPGAIIRFDYTGQ
jgi:PQQ-dependent dehydrogenase (s-GDH family)